MGLYAIAIRDSDAASKIPAILTHHGYKVAFERETDAGRFYVCEDKRKTRHFWISNGSPQRFSTSVGRWGDEIVRILTEHDIFEK